MEVVCDNAIQGGWILLLGCLKPLFSSSEKKDLQFSGHRVCLILVLWPRWNTQHAEQGQDHRYSSHFH